MNVLPLGRTCCQILQGTDMTLLYVLPPDSAEKLFPAATSGSEPALEVLALGGPASFMRAGGSHELAEAGSIFPGSDPLREILCPERCTEFCFDGEGEKDMLQDLVTGSSKDTSADSIDTVDTIGMDVMAVKIPLHASASANYDQSQSRPRTEGDAGDHFFSLSNQSDWSEGGPEASGRLHRRGSGGSLLSDLSSLGNLDGRHGIELPEAQLALSGTARKKEVSLQEDIKAGAKLGIKGRELLWDYLYHPTWREMPWEGTSQLKALRNRCLWKQFIEVLWLIGKKSGQTAASLKVLIENCKVIYAKWPRPVLSSQ
ncbi:hypothetical protein NDU88_004948 [Pleurodeles waltl]|uniref:Uncharacterized protein n=1 Tax=Pleurodeles waltl TaxID=8319 RepID=A0AAV7UGM4_PLEWA|nr:hypothetical protein NDU88_004948 [Pleurodeles waltl]